MLTATTFTSQNDAGSRASHTLLWEKLVLLVVLVPKSLRVSRISAGQTYRNFVALSVTASLALQPCRIQLPKTINFDFITLPRLRTIWLEQVAYYNLCNFFFKENLLYCLPDGSAWPEERARKRKLSAKCTASPFSITRILSNSSHALIRTM